MESIEVFPYRYEFNRLTVDQYNAAVAYCRENGVAYEDFSGDNRTDMLRTVQATPEQLDGLKALLEGASS